MPKPPSKPIRRALALPAAALLFGSCLFETAPGPVLGDAGAAGTELRYRVAIGGADTARCRITVAVLRWPAGKPLLFQAPPYYSDNPAIPVARFRAADFSAADSLGRPLAVRDTAPGYANLDGEFIVMPEGTRTIGYSIDHDPADPRRFGLPMPGLGAGVQAIDGAYYFILPVQGESFSAQWRAPASLHLDFSLDPGYRLVGQEPSATLRSNYELMFVRAAINPLRVSGFTLGNHIVTTYAGTADSFDIEKFNATLAACMRLVEDSLLPLPEKIWFAGEMPVFWGIEGTQGYWFRPETQSQGIIHTHTHELIHTFVGVRHGDLDDPWWKEGVTNYLGWLLPVQAGLQGDSVFRRDFTDPRDTMPSIQEFPLSAPYVRNHLFPPLDSAYISPHDNRSFTSLVYGKGGQAAMIIDRRILEGSGGRRSIFDLVRAMVGRYGAAFGREDLIAVVSELSGGDARKFLEDLLDKPGGFPKDSLVNTYNALQAMGRFLPGVPTDTTLPPTAFSPPAPKAGRLPGPDRAPIAIPPGEKL